MNAHPTYLDKTTGNVYNVGDIFVFGNAGRRKIISKSGSAKVVLVCNGEGDTCIKEARSGGLCAGCRSGGTLAAVVGEVRLCSDGLRHRKTPNGDSKILCIANDNTCDNLREDGANLCRAHNRGKDAQVKNKVDGQEYVNNGRRVRVIGGVQKILCCHNNDTCNAFVTVGGLCKTHSPLWKCKYTDSTAITCTKIRVDCSQYCTQHRGGVINKKRLPRLESTMMSILQGIPIRYIHELRVESQEHGRWFRYDFYIPPKKLYIEMDGKQHFSIVDKWGGDEGYAQRLLADSYKNEIAAVSDCSILRIHWKDIAIIRTVLLATFDLLDTAESPQLYLSPSYQDDNGNVHAHGSVVS